MQTLLAAEFRDTHEGKEAADILRSCVRCGFCTATCPTYQILGDELDGPRGRIALVKQVLEGAAPTVRTQLHLDRCLTCRACETTCPSGVRYGALLDIGRQIVDTRVARPWGQRLQRAALRALLTSKAFAPLYRLGQSLRWLLPREWQRYVRQREAVQAAAVPAQARKVILLAGCVQPAMAPNIHLATVRVLSRLGIEVLTAPKAGCCGSVHQHLGDPEGAKRLARANIDAWWPLVEQGAEALLSNTSGCGPLLADYGHLFANEPPYAMRAARLSSLAVDIAGLMERESSRLAQHWRRPLPQGLPQRIAFHAPCSLQHGLRVRGVVEQLLTAAGATLLPVAESHLCCGSAGTYSLLQPDLAAALRERKLTALTAGRPELILSANIGCITQLAGVDGVPVRHWIEWLDDRLKENT